QDVIVREEDCGTSDGFNMSADKEGEKVIVSLKQKIVGRYLQQDIKDPNTDEVIYIRNTLLTEEIATQIETMGYETIKVRSILTCESTTGVCSHCYGIDLSTLQPVEKGEAVGTIAAQSIGQPGTQLTMRTFHIGGTATTKSAESTIKAPYDAVVLQIQGRQVNNRQKQRILAKRGSIVIAQILARYTKSQFVEFTHEAGSKLIKGEIIGKLKDKEGHEALLYTPAAGTIFIEKNEIYLLASEYAIQLGAGSVLHAEEKDVVKASQLLCEYDPYNSLIIATHSGRLELVDVEDGKNLRMEDADDRNIGKLKKIVAYKNEKLVPRGHIYDKGKLVAETPLPVGAILMVENGASVQEGDIVAKIESKAEKTRDITGGLPRIDELFEARHPKDPCHLAEIDGMLVDTGTIVREKRVLKIIPDGLTGDEAEANAVSIAIPLHKQIQVHDGEMVVRGEPLDDGVMDPHDLLRIMGEEIAQRYLIREIQEVYRLQGVYINDKHIEIIIRQMMRKVEVIDAGDTIFVPMSQVDRALFKYENQRVERDGGAEATSTPILMGLTKASLNSESFLSAASFQETTRVLTDAAIKGKDDPLEGLKENIIIGHLIPAGTGMRDYRAVRAYKTVMGDLFYTEEELEEMYNGAQEKAEEVVALAPTGRSTDDDEDSDEE
ncbi:MAG TPA: DNA-directed RNA polymerase subunit beta', partial [Turneriella sp.]|nr:DNA-directed RNA polymerase subunit beta' [Turneriella sp.]